MSNEVKTPRSVRNHHHIAPLLRRAGKALVHNWGWKLGCLAAAVALWAFTLTASNKTLLRPVEFSDVTVTASDGAKDTLKARGLMVVSGLEPGSLSGFTLRANVPMLRYRDIKASDFSPRVNLSAVTSAGVQKVPVIGNSVTGKAEDRPELSPSEIEIEVEEYVTRSRIPVKISYVGDRSDRYYYPNASVDPEYVTIAGPGSLVNAVASCVVYFDRGDLALTPDTKKTAVSTFALVDRQENEIPSDMIEIALLSSGTAIDSFIVEQQMNPYIQMEISSQDAVTGQPAEGYRVRAVSFSPAFVDVVAEDPDKVPEGTQIFTVSPIDISGISQTADYRVNLSRPAGTKDRPLETKIRYMKTEIAWMTVEVEPIPQDGALPQAAESEAGAE